MQLVGKWAFIVGLVVALVAGFGLSPGWFAWVLAALGLVVGFLNISASEVEHFLIAAIGLMLSATAVNTLPYIGGPITRIATNLVAFIGAAVLVVALRSLFVTARH